MEINQILGWAATAIFTLMYVPQMVKTYKLKSVDSVSLPMFVLGLVGNIIALIYASLIGQKPLIIKYILALVAILTYVAIYFWAKKKRVNITKEQNMQCDKVHSDDRGTIYSVTGEFKNFPEVTLFKTNAGYARGGCIHANSREHLCVLDGEITYVYGVDPITVTLKRGDSITIEPNVPHYLESVTDSWVIEWGPQIEEKGPKYQPLLDIVKGINAKAK